VKLVPVAILFQLLCYRISLPILLIA